MRAPLTFPPTIAYAGRLVAKKGVDVLLEALVRVIERVPETRLVIAGDGPDRENLVRLTRQRGLGDHVTFVGHRSRAELDRLLGPAWVQAVPSVWEEPFGLVAAEAMMRGTAVVATRLGGLTEQVRDGETGLLVPPGDVSALADALVRLLSDKQLAEEMGARGRAVALAHFHEDMAIDRFLRVYARLLQAPRPAAADA